MTARASHHTRWLSAWRPPRLLRRNAILKFLDDEEAKRLLVYMDKNLVAVR